MRPPELSPVWMTLLTALYFTLALNHAFWAESQRILSEHFTGRDDFAMAIFVTLLVLLNLFLTLFSARSLLKPAFILLVVLSALVSFFMDHYGVVFDKDMLRNVVETDRREVFDLFSKELFGHVFFYGIVPALLIYHCPVRHYRWVEGWMVRIMVVVVSALILVLIGSLFYQDFASYARNNRHLRYVINPTNYLVAFGKVMRENYWQRGQGVTPIGADARLHTPVGQRRPNLLVFVVGETARATEFSLNGYGRETNPRLRAEGVVNFPRVTSCGTSTAVSVPCIFSGLGRANYSDRQAKQQEGLMDVLHRAGVQVLWRNNNSGCKGTCDRIPNEDFSRHQAGPFCRKDGCYDEVLLEGLQDYLNRATGDVTIVLHQKGSHGPTYHLRYPEQFHVFTPTCDTNQLQDCDRSLVVNTYDNTILYTDHFLGEVIALLKSQVERFNPLMLYVSDHGESLGENNLYLHGVPYLIAPEDQKHVPMVMWLSSHYQQATGLDPGCLDQRRTRDYSHDDLFHTVIGMMGVTTSIYQPELDILAPCRGAQPGVKTLARATTH